MSARRYTVTTLAAGQPRPYADSRHHMRVAFEWQGMEGFSNPDAPFVPSDGMSEAAVRLILPGLQCGFTPKTAKDEDCQWFDTRLDWLKQVSPGVWEFHTTSPYTD